MLGLLCSSARCEAVEWGKNRCTNLKRQVQTQLFHHLTNEA